MRENSATAAARRQHWARLYRWSAVQSHGPGGQEFGEHLLAASEIEAAESGGLDRRDVKVRQVFEFLADSLN